MWTCAPAYLTYSEKASLITVGKSTNIRGDRIDGTKEKKYLNHLNCLRLPTTEGKKK